MSADPSDLMRVAARELIQVKVWGDVLRGAGIDARVVGDNLTGGLGTALPGSVELWVRSADAEAAEAPIAVADRGGSFPTFICGDIPANN